MELTIEQTLQKAVEAHKAGKLQDAEAFYRAILQAQPKQPDANHNLGVLSVSVNKIEAALPLFKNALEANPNQGQFWISYIEALIKEGQFENAKNVLEQGKKFGLAGERVYALDAQLSPFAALQESEPPSQKQTPSFTPQRNEASSKKEEEKNLLTNKITLNRTKNPPKLEVNALLENYQKGQYALAKSLAKNIVQKYPNHQFSWKVLAAVFKHTGELYEALSANKRAVALKPKDAKAHYNLGNTLKDLGSLEDAETSYKTAIAIKPDLAEAHCNLGFTLQNLGRLEDAETSFRKAIAIKSDYAEAHFNLGNTLKDLGRLEDAETSYKTAIAIKPDLAEAHCNLAAAFLENDKIISALDAVIQSLKINSTFESKSLFIEISKKIGTHTWNPSLAHLATTAILESWGRPSDLMPFAGRLLKSAKEFVSLLSPSKDDIRQVDFDDSLIDLILSKAFYAFPLIQAMCTSTPIPDAELEDCFTNLRSHLLDEAYSVILNAREIDQVAPLFCSLAQQCFINEYIYFQAPEENDRSNQLRDQLEKKLETGHNIPAVWVIAVACYFPLYSVAGAEKLLHQKWSDDVGNVLIQQIQEPLAELNLRESIPALTSIDNQVSLAVQSQYEENPYPRWVRLPKDSNKKFLNTYIQNKFRLSTFSRLVDDRNPEVLIAGCGTGQHSIGTSQSFKGAKILAVDLSVASLAYAERKTIELNIDSIEYAQADLLKLGSLDRTFDVIESSGVLHHLENPFEGWEVLLSMLRPHGLMRLGFYSELARRDIVRVRELIRREGIGSSSQEIREYRKHLLGLKKTEDYGFATNSADFFSTSACRDLLFHVQEHRMNLSILAKFIRDHELNFLGFDINRSVMHSYKRRFPDDFSATNLDNWRVYEEENPDTFIGMYQFWVQKKF